MTSAQRRVPASMRWLAALHQAEVVLAWSLPEWQRVLRLSRRLRLLGRLAEQVEAAGLMDRLPPPVVNPLRAELQFSRWRTNQMRWTVERVSATLSDVTHPLVLLKGAAYAGLGLPIARGRLPSDLDILVPQAHLAEVQARLVAAGWVEAELDAHDQRYYREWSHEVPPMRHPVLPLELDLHHNILPPVARVSVPAAPLLARLQPSKWQGWQVLHPADQLLHSAVHLFHDSEARDRLRDLVDMDGLVRHFGPTVPDFWPALLSRAQELKLSEDLALACHFLQAWLDTPIPEAVGATLAQGRRSRHRWLLPLWATVLHPTEPDREPGLGQSLAAGVVLVRHHLGRMPLRLLIPHLFHKARAQRAKAAQALIADTPSDD
ncbi:nucleotidyltransferase domain-containing protein [Rubrivivax rivuli]|nr:nucleotidyltransferase family protein [Rubrivivax rivuli]